MGQAIRKEKPEPQGFRADEGRKIAVLSAAPCEIPVRPKGSGCVLEKSEFVRRMMAYWTINYRIPGKGNPSRRRVKNQRSESPAFSPIE